MKWRGRFTIHNYASLLLFVLVARGSRAGHQGPSKLVFHKRDRNSRLSANMAISDSHFHLFWSCRTSDFLFPGSLPILTIHLVIPVLSSTSPTSAYSSVSVLGGIPKLSREQIGLTAVTSVDPRRAFSIRSESETAQSQNLARGCNVTNHGHEQCSAAAHQWLAQ